VIAGRVQGVGFRPAVYRIARSLGLTGFVLNDTKGVTIELQGPKERIEEFLVRLRSGQDRPALAEIKSCDTQKIQPVEAEGEFVIRGSDGTGSALSEVTADIRTCGQCLAEMRDEKNFRYKYPFINCTNCGPRYSIVKRIPYDRRNTTMSEFEMCSKCAGQYNDIADRRFHAQPVACPTCGPRVWLADAQGKVIEPGGQATIAAAARLLLQGKIVAIKGIGGFHLAVNALDEQAVQRLRRRKRRDHKPFAMMAASVEKVRDFAVVSEQARELLESAQSPIVLLPKKAGARIATSVAPGVNTYGFMLCYAPLHFLLFAEGIEVLVMTSGNISDEPLICRNTAAVERLGSVADAFVMHDRQIYRQVDDSVVQFVDGGPALLRRARGYVPTPVLSKRSSPADILAAGPDMKNTFCLAKKNQLICSEHIGDLEDAEVYHHYINSIPHLGRLFEVEPRLVVCDMHPGYLSRRYALSLEGVEVLEVQHHWAHAASVLVENGVQGRVIALVCDGTGYGTDGAIWGCECMLASLEGFERLGHLAYFDLAGGDRASKEAIRPAISLLKHAYGDGFELSRFAAVLGRIEPELARQRTICGQIAKRLNTVATSSLGRVFDAVAALAGLGSYNHFDAQLPMALEAVVEAGVEERYGFELRRGADECEELCLGPMVRGVVEDIESGVAPGVVSAKFHNCLAAALAEMVHSAKRRSGLNRVALSGGVFCNKYLADRIISLLQGSGFEVLFNQVVPANDGGVSLGQAAIGVAAAANGRASLRSRMG